VKSAVLNGAAGDASNRDWELRKMSFLPSAPMRVAKPAQAKREPDRNPTYPGLLAARAKAGRRYTEDAAAFVESLVELAALDAACNDPQTFFVAPQASFGGPLPDPRSFFHATYAPHFVGGNYASDRDRRAAEIINTCLQLGDFT
jgi:hypothetical protein